MHLNSWDSKFSQFLFSDTLTGKEEYYNMTIYLTYHIFWMLSLRLLSNRSLKQVNIKHRLLLTIVCCAISRNFCKKLFLFSSSHKKFFQNVSRQGYESLNQEILGKSKLFSRIVYKTNNKIIFEAYRRKIIQYLSISTKTLYRRKNLKKI